MNNHAKNEKDQILTSDTLSALWLGFLEINPKGSEQNIPRRVSPEKQFADCLSDSEAYPVAKYFRSF